MRKLSDEQRWPHKKCLFYGQKGSLCSLRSRGQLDWPSPAISGHLRWTQNTQTLAERAAAAPIKGKEGGRRVPPKPPKRTRNLSGHSSGAVGGEEEVAGRAADELKRRAGEEVEGVGEEAAGRAQASGAGTQGNAPAARGRGVPGAGRGSRGGGGSGQGRGRGRGRRGTTRR